MPQPDPGYAARTGGTLNGEPEKALLTISPCTVSTNGKISVDNSRKNFEAMINPAGYEHTFSLRYSKNKVLGQPGTETKYDVSEPEKLFSRNWFLMVLVLSNPQIINRYPSRSRSTDSGVSFTPILAVNMKRRLYS